MRQRGRFTTHCLVAALVLLARAQASYGFSAGIASTVFGTNGCPQCHSGGTTPTVVLGGPTLVAPGSTADYTLTIFSNSAQNFGGLNVAAPAGVLATGGAFALGTRTITGLGGLTEITHTLPTKQGDFLNVIEFSFQWTAPPSFTSVTLRGWGNAVNHSGSPTGDAASLSTLVVSSSVPVDTPTASATPTATPTAFVCGDAAPLKPALVADPAALACQKAIAKGGVLYVKKDLKAVQTCLKAFQSGPGGDPVALCVGSATVAPTDTKAAAAIAKAQAKTRALLAAKCQDAAVAPLDACADTESAVETCFLAQHRQAVVDAVASEYGALVPTTDKGVQKCQAAIVSAAGGFLRAYLTTSQKCLAARNKAAVPNDGAALCVGAVAGGAFIAPTDAQVAAAVASAEAKLAKKVLGKCDNTAIAALATCGADQTSALGCLLCTHRTTVFALVSDEFGGVP